MKTKLTKDVVQQLFSEAEGSFIKTLNRSLKGNNYVEMFFDTKLGLCLMFHNSIAGKATYSVEKKHHIAKDNCHVDPTSIRQDTFELETSHIVIPCEELSAPEYTPITVSDILAIPRKGSSLPLSELLYELLSRDSTDFIDGFYATEAPSAERL